MGERHPQEVIVVGGGFGGLAAATFLADAGVDVRLYEQHDHLGGHAGVLERDGFRFDTGPSWYLMPDVFERFFGQFDREPSDYYGLKRLDPQYRVHWKDGDSVDVAPNRENIHDIFESYEDGAGETLDRYLDTAAENYDLSMERVLYAGRERLRDYLDPALLPMVPPRPVVRDDGRLRRPLFRPSKAPTALGVHARVSRWRAPQHARPLQHHGSRRFQPERVLPRGRIAGVVDALATLAREQGVDIETGVAVEEITRQPTAFAL